MIARLARWLFPPDQADPATPFACVVLLTVVIVEITRRMVG